MLFNNPKRRKNLGKYCANLSDEGLSSVLVGFIWDNFGDGFKDENGHKEYLPLHERQKGSGFGEDSITSSPEEIMIAQEEGANKEAEKDFFFPVFRHRKKTQDNTTEAKAKEEMVEVTSNAVNLGNLVPIRPRKTDLNDRHFYGHPEETPRYKTFHRKSVPIQCAIKFI